MSQIEITAFHPFSLQSSPSGAEQRREQKIVYYCESRFRQALLVISQASATAQQWMQQCLHVEVVGCSLLLQDSWFADQRVVDSIMFHRHGMRNRSCHRYPHYHPLTR